MLLGSLTCAEWVAQAEIEKVRKRREERAAERALQEEELSIMQRERAVLEGVEMEAKEEEVCNAIMLFVCLLVRGFVSLQELGFDMVSSTTKHPEANFLTAESIEVSNWRTICLQF